MHIFKLTKNKKKKLAPGPVSTDQQNMRQVYGRWRTFALLRKGTERLQ